MEKRLLLKNKYGDEIAKLFSFTYNAKRMGGAPTISASLSSFKELELTTDDYVEFNGEKYYIKHTPTSSRNNTDARYKYDLEFVSERIMLDDIYFYDTTHSTDSVSTSIAKSADFSFSGTVHNLADKINSSLQSSKVYGYTVIVGDDVLSSEDKLITFSNVFISNAIQEFYNTFEVPYYFYWDKEKGQTIIFVTHGSDKSPAVPFEYGKENALLSITKTNANYKIINKCTGVGSSENLPYYYPNISSTGEHTFNADEDFGETKINYDVLSKHTNLRDGATLTYHKKPSDSTYSYNISYRKWERVNSSVEHTEEVFITNSTTFKDTCHCDYNSNDGYFIIREIKLHFSASNGETFKTVFQCGLQTIESSDGIIDSDSIRTYYRIFTDDYDNTTIVTKTEITDGTIQFTPEETNNYYISIEVAFKLEGSKGSEDIPVNVSATFTPYRKVRKEDYFTFDDNNKEIDVSLSGVTVKNPKEGGQIVVSETLNWLEPQKKLMPSIYRSTNGMERYYIASNETVTSGGYTYDFDGHEFKNPYEEGRPKEHIITVDDLKPTNAGMSSNGENVDTFRDFAYDVNDNDEIDDGNHYKHPYFYAKLKKLDFNLFDQASESGEMIISFTSGKCASCKFAVVVDENTRKNLVQVDANGNLVFDENGVVKQISSYQAEQQDTINNEVWIALRKEDSTMGVVMPNVTNKEKPTTEDTFVITNINLPISYILKAEKLLEDKIKEYLINNNDDKFNFSIKFSRIYLEENEDVRNNISENSSITVIYQGKESDLYVSSYTYKMVEGEALPEITVELSDTLAQNNGIMRNVVSRVKMEVMTIVSNVDIIAQGARAFIRKDQNDQTVYRITANELNVNTDSIVGGDLDVGSNANVGGELSVKRKASFDENVEVGADVTVGDYQEILGEIQGAKISQQGDAVFKSLRANYLEIFTLIYNKIRATSAYTAFDDTATIIDVKVDDDGVYTLTFEGDDEYIQPFTEYDIVHGFVNKLNNYGYSISGECWMNIVEVQPNDNNNQVKAILFSDEDTPSKNIAPTKKMVICHRGNNAPKGLDDAKYDKRRNTFFISSADGNIVQLMDVTSPKLLDTRSGYSNYGVVIGKLPNDLLTYIQNSYSVVKEDDPVLYAKYLAVQNLLQIDHLGRPIKTERYRGKWSQNVASGNDPYRSINAVDVTYYDTVSHEGSKWQCFSDETTEPPSKTNTDWTIIVEKGDQGPQGEKGDSNKPQYEIKPSVNSIYYREATKSLSVDTLTVAIGETTSTGYRLITAQNELEQCGYHVEYSIKTKEGTVTDRTAINISMYGMIGTEDGLGVIATEDGQILWLEGDIIEVIDSYEEINLHLISNETGEERASTTVPIIYDGASLTVRDNLTRYQGSSVGNNHPSIETDEDIAKWLETPPHVEAGQYLWTWTYTLYSDGTPSDVFSVVRMGTNAEVVNTDVKYAMVEYPLSEQELEGKWGEWPSELKDGWWLYTRTIIEYKDTNSVKDITVTQLGTGSYYAGLVEYYALSTSREIMPNDGYPQKLNASNEPTGDKGYTNGVAIFSKGEDWYFDENQWFTQEPAFNKDKPYVWNFTISRDSSGTRYVIFPRCVGNHAKGIQDYDELYTISAHGTVKEMLADEAERAEYKWEDEHYAYKATKAKPYLWNKSVTKYNDGTSEAHYSLSFILSEAVSVGVTPSNIPIMVDPNEEGMPSLEDIDVELKAYVRLGNELVDPESELLNGQGWDYDLVTLPTGLSYEKFDTQYIYFIFRLPKGTPSAEIPSIITIPLVKLESREPIGEISVSISKSQRGIVGKQGEAGPIPIMRGWYDPTIAYKLERNSEGKVAGKPIVSKKEGNGETTRYMLEKDIPDDVRVENDKVVVGTYPNIIEVGLGTEYWTMATKESFLDAEVLFANFASFGGKNGAVFYDRYLFSQDGIDINGNDSDWTKHASVNDTLPMFDADGNFTGNFVPHFMVNLKKGVTKSNKFNEPFLQFALNDDDVEGDIYKMSEVVNKNGESMLVDKGFNASIQPRVLSDADTPYPAVVFMPYGGVIKDSDGNTVQKIDWDTDGTNSTIIAQSNNAYLMARYGQYKKVYWGSFLSYAIAIVSDGRYADTRSYKTNVQDGLPFNPENESIEAEQNAIINHGSHFIVGGMKTQVLYILPGDIVKMKSCLSPNGDIDWYVENYSDFGIIPVQTYITGVADEGINVSNGSLRYTLYQSTGEPAFGSNSIRSLLDEEVNVLTNNTSMQNGELIKYYKTLRYNQLDFGEYDETKYGVREFNIDLSDNVITVS